MEALPFVPKTVNGVPFHPLVVHAVVVLLPLAILGTIGIAVWPAMRRHLGLLVLAVAFVGLVTVPVATSSGEQFRNHLGAQQLVRQHQHYAENLLPWTFVLVVLLALLMAVDLALRLGPVPAAALPSPAETPGTTPAGGGVAVTARPQAPAAPPVTTRLDRLVGLLLPVRVRASPTVLRHVQPVLSVLSIAVGLVLGWYVFKTGDSGAKTVWQGR